MSGYEGFKSAAASATTEDYPEIVQLEDGGIFALRLNKIIASRPEPYETAEGKVRAAWESSKTIEKLKEQAAEIKAQLDNGARISSLGLPVTVETRITRDAFIDEATPDFLDEVFKLDPDGSVVVEAPSSVLIAQLSEVLPADKDNPDAKALREALNDSVRQGVASDLLDAFTKAMEAEAGISLNQTAINAVHAQFP